jgi:hypothetical protein
VDDKGDKLESDHFALFIDIDSGRPQGDFVAQEGFSGVNDFTEAKWAA